MPSEEYTIVMRAERFLLSADQLHFDSPNYFTMLFEGPFQEGSEGKRKVVLYRDPNLFRIIEHLSVTMFTYYKWQYCKPS